MEDNSNQHQLSFGPLLNDQGQLHEAGYAFALVKRYDRSKIKAKKSRIKEWDYYYVSHGDYGVAVTVADNGYMSLVSATVLELGDKASDITKSVMGLFPLGKLHLPADSRIGDVLYEDKKGNSFHFFHDGKRRHLICAMPDFGSKGQWFRCDITLEESDGKSMVIATPFKKKHHFYYNQKINNQIAGGYAKVGEKMYDFNKNSYGVLDWGRGVWTYRNTWYWCSVNASYQGQPIGWNLGYGFGDTKAASENMLFIGKNAYKLDDVRMDIPMTAHGKDDFMKPWKFRSNSGDINLVFTPKYDRHYDGNFLVLRSNQHQVFGHFSGYFVIEGKQIAVEDIPGFAEKVFNKW